MRTRNKFFEKGWTCNGTEFTGCKTKKTINYTDIYSVFYHDHETNFDLCLDCGKFYKMKAVTSDMEDSAIMKGGANVGENTNPVNLIFHKSPKRHTFLPV